MDEVQIRMGQIASLERGSMFQVGDLVRVRNRFRKRYPKINIHKLARKRKVKVSSHHNQILRVVSIEAIHIFSSPSPRFKIIVDKPIEALGKKNWAWREELVLHRRTNKTPV